MRRPTVIAFFPPVTEEGLAKDPDTNEALADFQVYAYRTRERLKNSGVEFHEVYVHSFRIRQGRNLVTFRPNKVPVGYYFVAPEKKPNVEYGVETDEDVVANIQKYFGIAIK